MNDWQEFLECVPWFLDDDADVHVSEARNGLQVSSSVADSFPAFESLLSRSSVTPVLINHIPHELLAWNGADGFRIGWLCLAPNPQTPHDIYPHHIELLRSIGGIVERFNEPEGTLLLNHADALTAREAAHDASFINDYKWAFDGAGVDLPIEPSEYYCIAREANGNTTLCHRETGEVILFAPDHSFDLVTPLDGCPGYTLYTIDGIVTFNDWVETLAKQWLANLVSSAGDRS